MLAQGSPLGWFKGHPFGPDPLERFFCWVVCRGTLENPGLGLELLDYLDNILVVPAADSTTRWLAFGVLAFSINPTKGDPPFAQGGRQKVDP